MLNKRGKNDERTTKDAGRFGMTFDLSEKIIKDCSFEFKDGFGRNWSMIKVVNVKEFIKLLKEELNHEAMHNETGKYSYQQLWRKLKNKQMYIIDKLAGESLVEEEN